MFRKRNKEEDAQTPEEGKEPVKLEKGDLLAIFIAAFLTFLPMLLIIAGVTLLIYWLFFGRFF